MKAGGGRIRNVDDDPGFRKTTRRIRNAQGYEVISESSGKQGLKKIREAGPDVVPLARMMESLPRSAEQPDTERRPIPSPWKGGEHPSHGAG